MQCLLSEMALMTHQWSSERIIDYPPAPPTMESAATTTTAGHPDMFLVYENVTNATFDLSRFQNNVQTWQNRTTDNNAHVVSSSSSHVPLFVLVVITVAPPTSASFNNSAEVVAQSLQDTIHDALTSPVAHVLVYLAKSQSHTCWETLVHTFEDALRRQQLQIIVDTTNAMGATNSGDYEDTNHDMIFAYLLHLAHVANLDYTFFLSAGTILKKTLRDNSYDCPEATKTSTMRPMP